MSSLRHIPISHLILKETNLLFTTDTGVVSTKKFNADIHLNPASVTVKADTSFMEVGSQPVFSSSIYIKIKPDMIDVPYFKMQNKDSLLDVSSFLIGKIESQKNRIWQNGCKKLFYFGGFERDS